MTEVITVSSETESKLGTIGTVADVDGEESEAIVDFLADYFIRREIAGQDSVDEEADLETTRKGTVDLRKGS